MLSIIYDLIIWIFLWFFGWFGWYLIPKHKRDYINNYLIVSLYFCAISLILIYIFRNPLDTLTKNLSVFPVIILAGFFVLNFLTFFLSNTFLRKPIEFIDKYSTVHYLKMDYRYLLSKSFEIFFQQILIVSLVLLLHENGLSVTWITIIFVCMFGFGHIPMLKLCEGFFGTIIFTAGIFSAFLFPYLILIFEHGYIYTYILHWFFYTNTGLLFWILKSKPVKEIKVIADEEMKKVKRRIRKANSF